MEIITLTKDQFDAFSQNHPLHTFYQTSMYGNLMNSKGYEIHYYGFNENNNMIGATLLLTKKLFLSFNYAYAPRGLLIDYNNQTLVKKVSEILKTFLSKKNIVFLKTDPPIVNNVRDENGNIVPSNHKTNLIPFLKQIGYNYYGNNKFFGTLKPRWHAILKVIGTSETIFDNFEPNIKNKIRKAQTRGVEIIQGHNDNDIEVFYDFVQKKHIRTLEYYKNFSTFFGDKFEIYFSKLNTQTYLTNVKKLYEKELTNNEEINMQIQEAGQTGKITDKLTNVKINSDKLLSVYKSELENASELFETNPDGLIISAAAYVISKYGVTLLIEGQSPKYRLFYPMFYNKWFVIEKYSKIGAVYFDLNAITGNFTNDNKFKGLNEMKLGYGADVYEYVGEFDLVINKTIYRLHKKLGLGRKKVRKQKKFK